MSVVYGYIYLLTNKINNKKYVGQTTRIFNERYPFKGKGAERMYRYHYYMMTHKKSYNRHLLSSFEKYGFDNFDVVEEFDVVYIVNGDYKKAKKELDNKEKYYIKLFDSMKNGYNKTTGGTEEYSVITTFKPDYSLKYTDERVKYVNDFVDGIYYKSDISQKQIDKMCYYLSTSYHYKDRYFASDVKSVNYLKPEKYNLLIDNLFMINSYHDNRKRGAKTYYKEPKWAIIDDNKKNINDKRKQKQLSYMNDTINNLKNFKSKLENKRDNYRVAITQSEINHIINYSKNDCNIRQKTEQKYNDHYIFDKLKNDDVEYTKDNIKIILKNWKQIECMSELNPYKTIECIKMDFENAFKKIKLTNKQLITLNILINGESITGLDRDIDYLCRKFYIFLNKN